MHPYVPSCGIKYQGESSSHLPGRVALSVVHPTEEPVDPVSIPGIRPLTFVSPSTDSRRLVGWLVVLGLTAL